ncbi:hypothetical protein PHILAsVB114_05615 [Candidatus Planktophila limnetica]|uniref:Exo-alpha-sialidase n=1 Tax=Candidatus Planktophila limnetica TaxID=573600 RepID=A0A249LG26_9ACTN|nr:hypothetical protein [Candidatus Planktophila limnetica]ASY28090.1 hypothetical protein PHILAsVB114_05615 [Candidatus Planktophila limnetica]
MKKLEAKGLKLSFSIFAIVALMAVGNSASAETLDSVSHIHHVKVVENKVHVLTHEGLYELVSRNDMKLVGKEKIDVMGFTTLGKALLASGHPAVGSKMPNPIGVMKSLDGGLTWKAISLVGKVDFHFLEGAGSDLYGADSQSGNLMYSPDSGKTWSSLGTNTFTDIAVSPEMPAMAIAIKNSELLLTDNAFKSASKIKNKLKITQIEWRKSGLYALSGTSLYKSTNSGKTWTKQSTFKGAPGILSVSDQMMLVTVGSEIYTSKNEGKKFKIFS